MLQKCSFGCKRSWRSWSRCQKNAKVALGLGSDVCQLYSIMVCAGFPRKGHSQCGAAVPLGSSRHQGYIPAWFGGLYGYTSYTTRGMEINNVCKQVLLVCNREICGHKIFMGSFSLSWSSTPSPQHATIGILMKLDFCEHLGRLRGLPMPSFAVATAGSLVPWQLEVLKGLLVPTCKRESYSILHSYT